MSGTCFRPKDWFPLARKAWPYAILVVMAAALFAPFLFQGKIFLAADTLYQFYPWKAYASASFSAYNSLITDPVNASYPGNYNRQVDAGHIDRWNPYILGGLPNTTITAMSGAPGRYYPVKFLLHRLLATPEAMTWSLVIHVLLMGVTMYLYLRTIGATAAGALFGGTAFMLNGYAMVWLEFESVVTSYAYLPLIFLCMEHFLGRRRFFWAFAGALVLGVMALIGQLQYLIYVSLWMFLYLAFLLWRGWRESLGARRLTGVTGCFALMGMGGILLGCIELLPMYEMMSQSSRIGRTFTFTSFFDTLARVNWSWLPTLIFPDFYGSPPLHFNAIPQLPRQEYMNYNELCLYLGIPTLLGILACLAAPRDRQGRFHLGMTALVSLLMTGTLVYYPFFLAYPGMNKMNPTRIIFLFCFSATVVAGLGISRLEELTRRQRLIMGSMVGAFTLASLYFAWAGGMPDFISAEFMGQFDPQRQIFIYQKLSTLRSLSSPVIFKPLILLGLSLAAFVPLLFLRPGHRLHLPLVLALTGILGYDLVTFGRGYNTLVDRQYVYPRTPGIDFLRNLPKPFRVLQDPEGGLWINSLMPFGVEEAGGYSSFYPERSNRYLSFVEMGPASLRGARFDRWVSPENLTSPLLDAMAVNIVLTAPGRELPSPRFRLLWRGDMSIYENTAAAPRVLATGRYRMIPEADQILFIIGSGLFDPRWEVLLEEPPDAAHLAGVRPNETHRVAVERYAPDGMSLRADMGGNGWLVVADSFYPGWVAEVDGRKTPIQRANFAFRAIPVPAGSHRVELSYRPVSVTLGTWLTLLSLAGCLTGAFLTRPRRGDEHQVHPSTGTAV